jgi:predicted MPP superfamily phosphohydrolase
MTQHSTHIEPNPAGTNRLLPRLWRGGQWLGLCMIMVLGLLLAVREFKDWQILTSLAGPWHWVGQIAVRAVLALPVLGLLALLVHPVRARRLMLGWLRRGWGRVPAGPASLRAPLERATATLATALEGIAVEPAPRPLSRRRFLSEAALFGGLVGYATLIEPYWLDVTRLDMPIANLPERFVGMRIAQLSDLHTNAYTTAEDIARVVAVINGLQPDVVLVTGDFVDKDIKYADDATLPLTRLVAPEGVYSVLGNHDYYTGQIEHMKWAIKRQDLGLLVNQHTTIRRGADTLTIIGLDDPKHDGRTKGLSTASIDPALALRGAPTSGPRLLLLHNPILVPHLVQQYDLDWILCGHTHGGQFRVPIVTDAVVRSTEFFVRGQYDLGRTQLYVNRGFGFTGPPLRFRVRPEVTLYRLVKAPDSGQRDTA